ncbi:MAG: cache domain-containing protein [Nitrososphaeraceae archaeon]
MGLITLAPDSIYGIKNTDNLNEIEIIDNKENTSQFYNDKNTEELDKHLIVKLLADNIELKLNHAITVIEFTSKLPEVKNLDSNDLLTLNKTIDTHNGVPSDSDLGKRAVALDVLDSHDIFHRIWFMLDTGHTYLTEPYLYQLNLTKNNGFLSHPHIKGAIDKNGTFLSPSWQSYATGLNTATITVPIFSENKPKEFNGFWVGALDLNTLDQYFKSLNLPDNQRLILIDQNGFEIADSHTFTLIDQFKELFNHMESFIMSQKGESGSLVEDNNGKKTLVFYHPIHIKDVTWTLLLTEKI